MAGTIAVNYQQQLPGAMGDVMMKEQQHLRSPPSHQPMTSSPRKVNHRDEGAASTTTTPTSTTSGKLIRVISFDLDNTLWCTTSTIGAGVCAVDKFRQSNAIQPAVRVEVVMKELFAANRGKYAPWQGAQATSPSQFTQLRLDAMQHLLTKHHGFAPNKAAAMAQQAFHTMATARHAAIPQHLAARVVETLQALRDSACQNENEILLIGAITDGNAHPDQVASLAPYFDFCIHAETVGVSKPHAGIFQYAVQQVQQTVLDKFQVDATTADLLAGWVHIGDDVAKDVAGAKRMGMRAIWCRELILSSLSSSSFVSKNKSQCLAQTAKDLACWSTTATSKSKSSGTAATDAWNGTDECAVADAVVDRFADIVTVLETWHKE